jgi:hypothetical protein
MFILPDGRPISPDVPFTLNDISYPANFLRLASPEERAAIGITEVPDPQPYDQRFYWGYTEDGELIPKDHTQLVEQWTQQTRTTAGTLLTPTDWLVVRELDNGTPVPEAWKAWRQAVREASELKVSEIEQTADTPELAAYITGADYPAWPRDPNAPPEPVPVDGVQLPVDGEPV